MHAWKVSYHGCVRSSWEDGEYTSKVRKTEPRSETADTREAVEQPEPSEPTWMPAYEALRQDWNSLIEDAQQAGIPLFYAKGYMDIITRAQTIAENPDIPAKSRASLIQVLENHQHYLSTRKWILQYPGEVERHIDRRATLRDVTADRENELTGVCDLPGLAAGGRAPDGGGRGHALGQGNIRRPS